MPSRYPEDFDTFPTNHADNADEIVHAVTVNDLADAINKMQREMGKNPSGTADSIAARFSTIGGGAGPGPPPPNLFIGATPPDLADVAVNSLYIPTNVDGTPKLIRFWEVYDGLTSGNGGNLFIQEAEPVPAVDALWIPLNVDGTAKYLDQWVVYTGIGTQPGIGNPNLFISVNRPPAPPSGSLHIPLNVDLTAKTIDTWEVYK